MWWGPWFGSMVTSRDKHMILYISYVTQMIDIGKERVVVVGALVWVYGYLEGQTHDIVYILCDPND